jgi:hypothetical protein
VSSAMTIGRTIAAHHPDVLHIVGSILLRRLKRTPPDRLNDGFVAGGKNCQPDHLARSLASLHHGVCVGTVLWDGSVGG